MGDNNEEIDVNDVVMAQPAAADKNKLIMQLMRQIAEMRVEMQRMQDGSNPVHLSTLQEMEDLHSTFLPQARNKFRTFSLTPLKILQLLT